MTPAEIVAEFRKKYESTYVFVQMPDSKEENLFFMNSVVAGGDGHGIMKLASEEFGKIQLNMATAHTIKFVFPKCTVFQNGTDANLFLREPRRQWQRGLCQGNGTILNVAEAMGSGPTSRVAGLEMNFRNVAAAFAGVVYSYTNAITMLKSGKCRSVALDNGYAVVLSPVKDVQYVLTFGVSIIAFLGNNGEVLRVLEESFNPHIKKVVS